MTDLVKPVRRRTNTTTNRGRRLVIEIRPGAIDTVFIREDRRRSGYTVPVDAIYKLGARMEADRARSDRANARRSRKESR